MDKPTNLFGTLVVARGMATQEQIDEALKLKAGLEKEGVSKHLGEILILQGILSVEQVEEVLKTQDKKILECKMCKTRYNVQNFDAGKRFTCKNCGVTLQIPDALNSVDTQLVEIEKPSVEETLDKGEALLVIKGKETNINALVDSKLNFIIGSSPEADLQLKNEDLSPLHCEIRNNGFDLLIYECAGGGRILVNNHPVTFFVLQTGDTITLGSVVINVKPRPKDLPPGCISIKKDLSKHKRIPTVSGKESSFRVALPDIDSINFGTYLIKKGYLSAQVVSQYMNEIEKLKKSGVKKHLGEILIERQVLNQKKFEEIVNHIRTTKQFKCFKCQLSYNVTQQDADMEFKCRGCGEWLIIPKSLFETQEPTKIHSGSEKETEEYDSRFGNLAVEHQFLTNGQLEELLKIQKEFKRVGKDIPLGDLGIKKGFLSQSQVSYILKLQGQGEDGGITIEGYDIRKLLGKGANGIVFQAIQKKSGKVVALKVLTPELGENKEVSSRFHREAGIAAYINHINLVSGVELGRSGDYDYFAMEYVRGETVRDMIQRTVSIYHEEAINIAIQVAKALDYLYQRKIIHRDIKPANILISKGGVAKLCDMGLAKSLRYSGQDITQPGVIIGTPYYLSPEQGQGFLNVDGRSDIYNLGATFYHMLTGQVPFKGQSPMETVLLHITQNPTPPDQIKAEISPKISECILKMMAKKPEDRFQIPADLVTALEELQFQKK